MHEKVELMGVTLLVHSSKFAILAQQIIQVLWIYFVIIVLELQQHENVLRKEILSVCKMIYCKVLYVRHVKRAP